MVIKIIKSVGGVGSETQKTGRILKHAVNTGGYPVVCLSKKGQGKVHRIHQLVAREWVQNPDGKICVDHIDGVKSNNHHENLRYATHAENGRNMEKHSDGSSVYKGVSYKKAKNKWQAQIQINGKQTYLGLFYNEREAAKFYNTAALEHFGIFAKLNEIED